MSAGLPVPKRVFGHGFLNVEGAKMSKSLGNVLSPQTMVEEFGLDQLRYFLLREVPYGSDGSFSREQIINRINGDLANDYGNLAQRVLSMINKNCSAAVPEPGAFTKADEKMLVSAADALADVRASFENLAFHEALERIWSVIRAANAYTDHQAPWALRKEDPTRMATVLYVLAETVRCLAILTQPFMPRASARLLDQLGVAERARDFAAISARLVAGTSLPKPEGVFPRFVQDAAE